jgi:hypothetical protein
MKLSVSFIPMHFEGGMRATEICWHPSLSPGVYCRTVRARESNRERFEMARVSVAFDGEAELGADARAGSLAPCGRG